MAEIHHTSDGNRTVTTLVIFLVLAVIGVALWFAFDNNSPAIPNTGDINVENIDESVQGGIDNAQDALDPDDAEVTY